MRSGIFFAAIIAAVLLGGCNSMNNTKTAKIVVFETNQGNFELEIFTDKAPITSGNFIEYVKSGYYNGLIFHRVIDGFMIQGGGFTPDMKEKDALAPIKNEADNGLKNLKYTIAMARTSDINSATSQFFINVKDNPMLDYRDSSVKGFGYAVFGRVISGFEVIDKIKTVKTQSVGYYDDVPVEPVIIQKAYIK